MRPIRSFDVSDTLIARRCIDATGVYEIVEERSRIASLAAARLLAGNAHSDVAMPRLAGIKDVLVQQHVPTPAERRCLDAGLHELAQVMRAVRLASAFTGEADVLWRSACQLNFPLLVMASQALEATCLRSRPQRLVFFARDGNQWIDVHRTLYPDRESRYLFCSRETFLVPCSEFDAYFDEQSGEATLYVDLFSTGSSFSTYLAARRRRGQLFVICKADDMRYRSNAVGDRGHLTMHSVLLRSSLPQSGRLGLGLEMANFALHRRTRRVLRMPGGHLPVFADEREYDERKVAILHAAIRSCLRVLDVPRCLHELAKVDTEPLMTAIYIELNGNRALWRCFPEHHAADVRYLARLSAA